MTNYQVMPELTAEEYAELRADIAERGIMIPIEYDEQGNVLDGYHRLKICEELGIKDYPRVIRAGMTEAEKLAHARKLNIARRHLTSEQKRELIREQLKDTPEQSDRQIAKALGVSDKTVGSQRRELEGRAEIPHIETSIDTLGREQPRIRKPVSVFITENLSGGEIPNCEIKPHVSYNSGNNEWYTPSDYIELARAVMGDIDLDPASSYKANEVVQAKTYYTAQDDGLSQDWQGRVWLNPPYSSELIVKFTEKLIAELSRISQALVLVNNATETEWFSRLVSRAGAVCFPKSRVKFYMPDGTVGAPLQGQALLYFGAEPQRFVEVFRVKGWCALPQ